MGGRTKAVNALAPPNNQEKGSQHVAEALFLAVAKFAPMWITPETLEAPPGFDPGHKGFAGLCLTARLRRLKKEGLHVLSDGLTPLPKRETGLEPATPTLATLH